VLLGYLTGFSDEGLNFLGVTVWNFSIAGAASLN